MRIRHISIRHRIQALVLAAAMIFTSLNITMEGRATATWGGANRLELNEGDYVSQVCSLSGVSTISAARYAVAVSQFGDVTLKTTVTPVGNPDDIKWESTNTFSTASGEAGDNPTDTFKYYLAERSTDLATGDAAYIGNILKGGLYNVTITNMSSNPAIIYLDTTATTFTSSTSYGWEPAGMVVSLDSVPTSYPNYDLGTNGSSYSLNGIEKKAIAVDMTDKSASDDLILSVNPKEPDGVVTFSDGGSGIIDRVAGNTAYISLKTDGLFTVTVTSDDGMNYTDFSFYGISAMKAEPGTYGKVNFGTPSGRDISNIGLKYGANSLLSPQVKVEPVNPSAGNNVGKYDYKITLLDETLKGIIGDFVISGSYYEIIPSSIKSVEIGEYFVNSNPVTGLTVCDEDNRTVPADGYDAYVTEDFGSGDNIKYTVTVKGKGYYEGSKSSSREFSMTGDHKFDLSNFDARIDVAPTYTGVRPSVSVIFSKDGSDLASQPVQDVDYECDFGTNGVGNKTVVITAKADSVKYKGRVNASTSVEQWNISDAILSTDPTNKVSLSIKDKEGNDVSINYATRELSAQKYVQGVDTEFGSVVLRNENTGLELDTNDYDLVYRNHSGVTGDTKASLTIRGKGNFNGSITLYYDIVGTFAESARLEYEVNGNKYSSTAENVLADFKPVYSGANKRPANPVLFIGNDRINSNDYTITYADDVNASTDSVKAKAKVQFKNVATAARYYATTNDIVEFTYDILPKNLSDVTVTTNAKSVKKYTGAAQNIDGTEFSVTDGVSLDGSSYEIDFSLSPDRTNAGTYTAYIRGKGNYQGTAAVNWEIIKRQLPDAKLTVGELKADYTGLPVSVDELLRNAPVKLDGNVLNSYDYDYKLYDSTGAELPANGAKNAGTYYVEIIASSTGNLTGRNLTKIPLVISKKTADLTVYYDSNPLPKEGIRDFRLTESFTYTGSPISLDENRFKIFDNGTPLTYGVDWRWNTLPTNVTNVGKDNYTSIRFYGNYDDTNRPRIYFEITPITLANAKVSSDGTWEVIDGKNYPKLTVTYEKKDKWGIVTQVPLYRGTDYNIVPLSDDPAYLTTPGEGKRFKLVEIPGGTYSGEKEIPEEFTLGKNIKGLILDLDGGIKQTDKMTPAFLIGKSFDAYDYTYDGKKPLITLKDGSEDIIPENCTIKYYDYYDGHAITDENELKNYKGDLHYIYAEITPNSGQVGYYLKDGDRVGVVYRIKKRAATATDLDFVATFEGGSDTVEYSRIDKKIVFELKNKTDTIPSADYVVKAYLNDVEVASSKNGEAFLIIPFAKADAGDYKIKIKETTGSSNYDNLDTATPVDLKITSKPITAEMIIWLDGPDYEYTEIGVEPKFEVKDGSYSLVSGKDYTVSGNKTATEINKGRPEDTGKEAYNITISGTGNYSDSAGRDYWIKPKSLATDIIINIPTNETITYDGTEKKIERLTVTDKNGNLLEEHTDYEVIYTDNVKPGKAKVTVRGIDKYTGSKTEEFPIMIKLENAILAREVKPGTKKYTGYEDGAEHDLVVGEVYVTGITKALDILTLSNKSSYTLDPRVSYITEESDILTEHVIEGGIDKSIVDAKIESIAAPGPDEIVLKGVESAFVTTSKDIKIKVKGSLSDDAVTVDKIDDVEWNGLKNADVTRTVVVKYGTKDISSLVETDWSAYKADSREVGKFKVIIKAITSEYLDSSTREATFDVFYNLNKAEVVFGEGKGTYTYTGSDIEPKNPDDFEVKITANSKTVTVPIEYLDITYANNIMPTESASIIATAKADTYAKYSKNGKFIIKPVTLTAADTKVFIDDIELINEGSYKVPYNGRTYSPMAPNVKVQIRDGAGASFITLDPKDFTITYGVYENNTNASITGFANPEDNKYASLTIHGARGFDGAIEKLFTIEKLDLSTAKDIALEKTDYYYEGGVVEGGADYSIKPKFTLSFDATDSSGNAFVLTAPNSEYEAVYDDVSKSYGTAKITVSAKSDSRNYTGIKTKTYNIKETSISDALKSKKLLVTSSSVEYTGEPIVPEFKLELVPTENTLNPNYELVQGKDYTIPTGTTFTDKKVYKVTLTAVTGSGFKGSIDVDFEITKRKITNEDVKVTLDRPDSNYEYKNKQPVEPEVSIIDEGMDKALGGRKLVKDKDYTVEYFNNTLSGAGVLDENGQPISGPYIKITAKEDGNYMGERYIPFSIGTKVTETTFELNPSSKTYDGTYHNVISPKNHAVYFNGTKISDRYDYRNYYDIQIFDGDTQISSIVNAGVYTIKVLPKGGYYGELTAVYTVDQRVPEEDEIEIQFDPPIVNGKVSFTGEEIEPPVRVYDKVLRKFISSSEYEIFYDANKDISTEGNKATVRVVFTGAGNYYNSDEKHYINTFEIVESPIFDNPADFEVKTGVGVIYYTGENDRSGLDYWEENDLEVVRKYKGGEIKLIKDVDYTIDYKFLGIDASRANPDPTKPCIGRVKITITGINNYSGNVVLDDKVGMYANINDAYDESVMYPGVFKTVDILGSKYEITRELNDTQYGDPAGMQAVVPSIPTLKLGGTTIIDGTDYAFTKVMRDNEEGSIYGYGYVVIQPTGKNPYVTGGPLLIGYYIDKSMSVLKLELIDRDGNPFELDRKWNGEEHRPGYVIKEPNGKILVKSGEIVDSSAITKVETVSDGVGVNPGTYTVRINVTSAQGEEVPLYESYVINPINLDDANKPGDTNFTVTVPSGNTYHGSEVMPPVTVTVNLNGKPSIVSNRYYDVTYENNIGPNGNTTKNGVPNPDIASKGKATVTPKPGVGGGLTGSATVYFDIKVPKPTSINVITNPDTPSMVSVSWPKVDGPAKALSYEIDLYDSVGNLVYGDSTRTYVNSASFWNLKPLTNYEVRVYTVVDVGSGVYYSEPLKYRFATKLAPTVNSIAGAAEITWIDDGVYAGYVIYRSTVGGKNMSDYSLLVLVGKNKDKYQDKNVVKGQTYYYRICGVNEVNGRLVEDRDNISSPTKVTVQ